MPNEGWRSLLETNWAGCVILHNLPFGFTDIHKAIGLPATLLSEAPTSTLNSIYELQKSAAKWCWYDFKA